MSRMWSALWLAGLVCAGCGGAETDPESGSSGFPNDRSPLGTNLFVASWSSELPWKDVFKQSRPWVFAGTTQGAPLTADGWPATDQPVETILFEGLQGHYPKGQYTCLYQGEGRVEIAIGNSVFGPQSPGKIVFEANTDDWIYVRLSAMNPANPVRNLRVIMPGFESDYLTQPFHPAFLERNRKYKVFRLGDWQLHDVGTPYEWKDRSKTTDCTQMGRRGVALEHMIQLCNTLNADIWLSMQYWADDVFIEEFAKAVKGQLNSNLKVYLEYSNEVWNDTPGAYPQHGYANQKGMDLNLGAELPPGWNEDQYRPFVAGRRYYSQRSVEIFKVWKRVFGSYDRIVRVLASHTEQPDLAQWILDWKEAYKEADVLAIGGYFGVSMGHDPSQPVPADLDGMFQALPASIAVTLAQVKQNWDIASARGLSVVAYEGGQHLTLNGQGTQAQMQLMNDANRDPRMKQMYKLLLDGWRQNGGRMFLHEHTMMQFDQNGSWGALEWHDQTHSPKHDALMEFIDANPRWW